MIEEKMLIKKEKQKIFQKIHNFIKKLFHKEEQIEKSEVVEENKEESNMIYKMKRTQETMKLQKEYEEGIVQEKNLTEDEKEELIQLYKEQIKTLEENIIMHKKNLQYYKTKIMEMKEKIGNKN